LAGTLFVSNQFFVGDDLTRRQPAVLRLFNVHASYQINKTFRLWPRRQSFR
jgi:hypothetical protein